MLHYGACEVPSKTKQKLSKSFYAGLEAQNLKKTVIRSSSTFSKSQFIKEKSQAPTFRQESDAQRRMRLILEKHERKSVLKTMEHLRRSEAAKKGWITRRANIEKKYKEQEEIALKIFQPEDMFRCTWGTGLSDRNEAISFTLYSYSKEPLDLPEQSKVEKHFADLLTRYLKSLYPKKTYSYEKDWDVFGHPQGQHEVITRMEENVAIDYDGEDIDQWVFEVDSNEYSRGDLKLVL